MSRWDILLLCVYISNSSCTPLELLWWDNQLTLIGAFALTSLLCGCVNSLLFSL